MTSRVAARSVPSRILPSLVTGWLVSYTVLRIALTDSPRSVALLAIPGAVAIGGLVLGALVALDRRRGALQSSRALADSGPTIEERFASNAGLVRFAAAAALAFAAVAGVVGFVVLAQFGAAPSGARSIVRAFVGGIEVAVAAIAVLEGAAILRRDIEGLDAVGPMCAVTAMLAGVALSESRFSAGQIVLIALAGVAGVLASVALTRIRGDRGFPVGPVGIGVIAVLSLVLPLIG